MEETTVYFRKLSFIFGFKLPDYLYKALSRLYAHAGVSIRYFSASWCLVRNMCVEYGFLSENRHL